MQWSDISFSPTNRTLRQFAGLWLAFFGVGACLQGFVRHHMTAAWILAAAALIVGLTGLVRPALIRLIYVGAVALTFPIGWTVSKILLACLFYGLFTPVAVVFRLMGRDVLARRPHLEAETYWLPKALATDPRSYFRPF